MQLERLLYRLPWPPCSANNNYTVRRGRKVLSDRARTYREAATIAILKQARPAQPVDGPLVLRLGLVEPAKPRRRRDADNYAKGVIDALVCAQVITDDDRETIRLITIEWLGRAPEGYVEVEIAPYPPEEP